MNKSKRKIYFSFNYDNSLSYLFNGFSNKIDYELTSFDHDKMEMFQDQILIGNDFMTALDKIDIKGLSNHG